MKGLWESRPAGCGSATDSQEESLLKRVYIDVEALEIDFLKIMCA